MKHHPVPAAAAASAIASNTAASATTPATSAAATATIIGGSPIGSGPVHLVVQSDELAEPARVMVSAVWWMRVGRCGQVRVGSE